MLRKTLLTFLLSAGCITLPLFADTSAVTQSNLVQLDGSGSEDADGDRLIYSWRQITGPKVELLNPTTAKPSFYAEVAGEYSFELIVSDGRIKSKPAVVQVLIEEANEIPVASLPAKISIELGESAILDGSRSSDADNDALIYNFSQVAGPVQILRSTVSQDPQYTIVPQTVGTYSFELIVNDGRANSTPALCIVEVAKPNSAPVAKVTAPTKAIINPRHRLIPAAQPASTTQQRIIIPKNAAIETASLPEIPESKPRKLTAKVQLADSSDMPEMFDEIEQLSSAQPANITPIASTSRDMTVTPGSKVVIKGFGVDPDGDSLQFTWNQKSGPRIPGSPIMRKNLAFIPRQEGTYVFELIVNDGQTDSEPAICSVTVKNTQNSISIPATLNDREVVEDLSSLELAIPAKDDSVKVSTAENSTEDDISFRELFSID